MRKNTLLLIVSAVIVAAGSFIVTVLWADVAPATQSSTQRSQLTRWLNLTDDQQAAIRMADPDFDANLATLQSAMNDQRQKLASLVESDDSTDEQIMDQMEKVIRANEDIERRVARHILKIRMILDPQQRTRLMNLCANAIRQGGQGKGPRWRGGRGDGGGQGQGFRGGGGGGGHGRQGGPQSFAPGQDQGVNTTLGFRFGSSSLTTLANSANCPYRNARNAADNHNKTAACPPHEHGNGQQHQCRFGQAERSSDSSSDKGS